MEVSERNKILDHLQIKAKIERIAHEIHENYHNESTVHLIGIEGRGFDFAKRVQALLISISELNVQLDKICLDKDKPLENTISIAGNSNLANESVLLVDDVLNSGKTLAYAASHLLSLAPKSLRTVILVNREHHQYPVTADFVGLSLATTMKEHISVEFGEQDGVYLD